MSLANYPELLTYALKLLERHGIYGDPHEIVEDAYIIYEWPEKKHVKKVFCKRYGSVLPDSKRKLPRPERRTCKRCNIDLPIESFTRDGGIRYTCDSCLDANARRWRSQNQERARAIARKSYHKNKDRRLRVNTYSAEKYKQWRSENPEKVKAFNDWRREKRRKPKA